MVTREAVLSSFHIYSLEHTEQPGPRTLALVSALSLLCYSTQTALLQHTACLR